MNCTLLFEGPDRCGKTLLIDLFRKKHHTFKYEKMRVPRQLWEAVNWYEEFFQSICNGEGNKIWDRSHISEAVYAPLYRNYVHINWPSNLWNYEEQYLRKKSVFIVYVYPIWTDLLRPDERPNASLQRELVMYNKALGETGLPVINITKHETKVQAWRSELEVLEELEEKVSEQLDLFDARS